MRRSLIILSALMVSAISFGQIPRGAPYRPQDIVPDCVDATCLYFFPFNGNTTDISGNGVSATNYLGSWDYTNYAGGTASANTSANSTHVILTQDVNYTSRFVWFGFVARRSGYTGSYITSGNAFSDTDGWNLRLNPGSNRLEFQNYNVSNAQVNSGTITFPANQTFHSVAIYVDYGLMEVQFFVDKVYISTGTITYAPASNTQNNRFGLSSYDWFDSVSAWSIGTEGEDVLPLIEALHDETESLYICP